MKIVTAQMLRDKLFFEGPTSYIDLLDMANTSQDVAMLTMALEKGLSNGMIKHKTIGTEQGFAASVYYTEEIVK